MHLALPIIVPQTSLVCYLSIQQEMFYGKHEIKEQQLCLTARIGVI